MTTGNPLIVEKPWGYYAITTAVGNEYVTKKLVVYPGKRISLQKHFHRDEIWYILNGNGKLTIGTEEKEVARQSVIHIPNGMAHRIENTSEHDNLVIFEVQIASKGKCDELDIERIEDDFGR